MADVGMSDLTKRVSCKVFRHIQQTEIDYGPRIASEIAEAHVDAGARYLNGECIVDLSDLPTASAIQNQM